MLTLKKSSMYSEGLSRKLKSQLGLKRMPNSDHNTPLREKWGLIRNLTLVGWGSSLLTLWHLAIEMSPTSKKRWATCNWSTIRTSKPSTRKVMPTCSKCSSLKTSRQSSEERMRRSLTFKLKFKTLKSKTELWLTVFRLPRSRQQLRTLTKVWICWWIVQWRTKWWETRGLRRWWLEWSEHN